MIRLFLIEDQCRLVLGSLRYYFREKRDGIKVSGFAENVDEAVEKADPGAFDLFVLDLHIPGYKPLDNFRMLKKHFPRKGIVIYTYENATAWRQKMMKEGANAYITKNSERGDFKTALIKAAKGEIFYFGKKDADSPLFTEEETMIDSINVTPVQLEIMLLLSKGWSQKQISEEVGLSIDMIKKILNNLRKSFHVKNTIQLISLFTRSGLI